MFNLLSKTLVLIHATLAIMAMIWGITIWLQGRDYGWIEPYKEVLEWHSDGKPKLSVVHASEYDKSFAAAKDAERVRDRTYVQVKPAIESLRSVEPHLSQNHLVFTAEVQRLWKSTDPIEVRRLKQGGAALDTVNDLGKPVADEVVPGITKSYKSYEVDLKELWKQIKVIEEANRKIAIDTKKLTAQLTGKDEQNEYVHPGLYQLTDLEFSAQKEIRVQIDAIKPYWSKAVEQARLHQYRRTDLEATLQKLTGGLKKDDKKMP